MKNKPFLGSSIPILIVTGIITVVLFRFLSCSKDDKNPVKPSSNIDNYTYKTVQIGDQVWMAENLKVTHYRNGDAVPNVTNASEWENLSTGAYCNYDNKTTHVATYGRLYNWYAVNDSRNIAPIGWHVASDAEWQTLIDYLGGADVFGGKLKEMGNTHWQSPNTGATNESGFSALPGGVRYSHGEFTDLGYCACFWSSTETNNKFAMCCWLLHTWSGANHMVCLKYWSLSVRCVKD
jgi:uncharacterized protein (TIGR02145 family)